MSHEIEQKNIAKNTIFLYIRMIVVMGVSLYTSRVVLDKLGVGDYGIYNIVGSVVVSLTFISNALVTAMRRFFSYQIGEKGGNCSDIFTMSFKIQLIIIAVLLILLETVGLWFFENVIKIPEGRETAASIVYQFSIIAFLIHLLQVPYASLIVAREKMSIFAIFSIIDVGLKLLIVYLLSASLGIDKLVLYGMLMMLVSLVILLSYYVYCKITLRGDSRVTKYWNKEQFKEIFSFASWNLVGGITTIGTTEVPNYFINYYLGVAVNAAMGVAKQVSTAVYTFSSNFQTAFNPQIIKAYAAGENNYLVKLIFRTSKLSFLLMYVIAVPFLLCSGDVLNIWLKVIPEYTGVFCLCIILAEMVNAIAAPLWMTVFAIGNIRNYQIIISVICLTVIPASWLVLSFGFEPYWILVYKVFVSIAIMIYRIQYLSKKINFPAGKYYKEIVLRFLLLIPLLSLPELLLISNHFCSWVKIIVVSLSAAVVILPLTYYFGFDKKERISIKNTVLLKIKKGRR